MLIPDSNSQTTMIKDNQHTHHISGSMAIFAGSNPEHVPSVTSLPSNVLMLLFSPPSSHNLIWLFIWGFPEMVVPPVIIHFRLEFSLINHPAIGGSPHYGHLHLGDQQALWAS